MAVSNFFILISSSELLPVLTWTGQGFGHGGDGGGHL